MSKCPKCGKIIRLDPEDINVDYFETTSRSYELYFEFDTGDSKGHAIASAHFKHAGISWFQVEPSYRGLGRQLWEKMEKELIARGIKTVSLSPQDSDAEKFWAKMGFKPIEIDAEYGFVAEMEKEL